MATVSATVAGYPLLGMAHKSPTDARVCASVGRAGEEGCSDEKVVVPKDLIPVSILPLEDAPDVDSHAPASDGRDTPCTVQQAYNGGSITSSYVSTSNNASEETSVGRVPCRRCGTPHPRRRSLAAQRTRGGRWSRAAPRLHRTLGGLAP